ncbi:peroxin 26 [Diplodia corticola]|uniref:Peroxin 26 n=1 Tax=Diplodia corticola TaxID=236234 RepID=A0A1J9QYY2_9PEZI|nr:peroxin 26 [Diplodia corticola]OJD33608.1 peroxin 26 [Diplodia corticola]
MSMAHANMLSASVTSLGSPQRPQTAQIAKAYRQAAQLFLTRRLPEALSTIEPVITPDPPDAHGHDHDSKQAVFAPVAYASRGTRVKVWSFYLTFLNSVIELGPEEGKHAFGSTKWKALVSKCRDGRVWEEVVQAGYGGVEGSVDPDVVINLATLLLTHAPSQQVTQQRLETFLSTSSQPTFDITAHMNSPLYAQKRPGIRSHGTNTPRDLNSRLKLLELYTLHVLPRNDEWDYAREFIGMSEVLDDERKEAFLLALHGLKEEQEGAAMREAELRQQQQEQLERRRQEAETRRREAEEEEARRRREQEDRETRQRMRRPANSGSQGPGSTSSNLSRAAASASSRAPRPGPNKKALSPRPRNQSVSARASAVLGAVQNMFQNATQSLTKNPMAFLRTLLFLLAFALAFGRQDLRDRVKRLLRIAWEKMRRTVGMGVKVSYI